MTESRLNIASRLSGLAGWRDILVSVIVGVGIALGQVPFSAFWAALPSIGFALLLAITATSPRHAARRGLAIGTGFAALTFIWIVEPFLVDIARDGWMAPFALIFMALGIGLFWAAAFFAARRLAGVSPGVLLLAVSGFWTAAEILRSYALTGFPWALTSYIWIETPVYQLAAFIGPHGLTLLTVLLVSSVVYGLLMRTPLQVGGGLALMAGFWIGGSILQNQPDAEPAEKRPMVRLIQPNARQDQKWDPAMMPVFYNRQLTLTAQEADVPLDLIVWPEVAVPFLLNDPSAPFWEISGAADDVPVVIGAQRLGDQQAFNSMALLGPGGEIQQIYDKRHLVPFGEYLPLGSLLNRIGLKALTAQYGNGYTAGTGKQLMDLGALGKVLPLICYEAIFPHELRRAQERPDWMLMITNDAWFGDLIGPFQHLAQARARAVEFGLPMVRAANTGVSAVIDARGRITASLPLGVSDGLDAAIPTALPPTWYWRFGDAVAALALIVLAMAVFGARRRNPIDHPGQQG